VSRKKMNSFEIKIGQNFKTLREALGLSQIDFAKTIKVTNSYISAIEKGKPKRYQIRYSTQLN